jgi:hypothetical protein
MQPIDVLQEILLIVIARPDDYVKLIRRLEQSEAVERLERLEPPSMIRLTPEF